MILVNDDEEEQRLFLEDQLEWTKERMQILEQLQDTLIKMRKIAACASSDQVTSTERDNANKELRELELEVNSLQELLKQDVH